VVASTNAVVTPHHERRKTLLQRRRAHLEQQQRWQRHLGHQLVEAPGAALVQQPHLPRRHTHREDEKHRGQTGEHLHGDGVYGMPARRA
jgi:hypothetical protein